MIEVIATSLEDALAIEAAGGQRIELVSAMDQDGLTPPLALVKLVTESLTIPVNVMVRDQDVFSFSPEDFQKMLAYIDDLKATKAKGIVWGSLKHGRVDWDQLNQVNAVWSGDITFHRAIDRSCDLLADYRALSTKVTQILSSGGPGKAEDHLDILDKLYAIDPEKLLIGSGINGINLKMFQQRYPNSSLHIGSGARHQGDFQEGIDLFQLKKITGRG